MDSHNTLYCSHITNNIGSLGWIERRNKSGKLKIEIKIQKINAEEGCFLWKGIHYATGLHMNCTAGPLASVSHASAFEQGRAAG